MSEMDETGFRDLIDYLKGLDTDQVEHTDGTFLAHLVSVYRDMKAWGADEELSRAAMFHSIYGTELFQKFKLSIDRRGEVRDLIGERAERLAYLNCAIHYDSFDREVERGTAPFGMLDRFIDEEIELNAEDFEDLCRIQLCDRLEQLPRSKHWDFRREAYRRMADRLGGVAAEAYEKVWALETA